MNTENNKPVDIIGLASGRYKIGFEEACESKSINKADSWELVILCKFGEIFPYSNRILGFHCKGRIMRNRIHEDCPNITVRNWSDSGEAIFLFEEKDFELIAKYALPKKIKRLSGKRKEAFINDGREALKVAQKSLANKANFGGNKAIDE
jgi:hypothetical protein